ncbi:hypothetical protein MRX96_049637 [Rhipicephalus microplus]
MELFNTYVGHAALERETGVLCRHARWHAVTPNLPLGALLSSSLVRTAYTLHELRCFHNTACDNLGAGAVVDVFDVGDGEEGTTHASFTLL